MRSKRSLGIAVAATVTAGLLSPVAVGAIGATADAKTCMVVDTKYKTSKGEAVWKPTGLAAGRYQKGGSQSIAYSDGTQYAKTKGSSDSVGGDAGVNFGIGSASANYNHTWNRSTTTTTSASKTYSSSSPALPKNAFTRWALYHKAYRFKTTVTVITNSSVCGIKKHSWMVVVPTKSWSDSNIHWDVQYQAHPGRLH